MKLEIPFDQGVLIQKTGSQMRGGVCMGLVVQWLVSISKILSDEDQYWKDLKKSVDPSEDSGLKGVGYARLAIENQVEYARRFTNQDYSYVQTVLNGARLTRDPAGSVNQMPKYNGAAQYAGAIGRKALSDDGRYVILVIEGQYAHAIGLYREIITSNVKVFDPNIGRYDCSSDPADVAAAITAIFTDPFYLNAFNGTWSWDSYK